MVRTLAFSPTRVTWIVGTILALHIGLVEPVGAQDGPKPRVRSILKAGNDSHKRGDFEAAAKYFEMADAAKSDLNPTEQKDLQKFIELNNQALQGRRDGTVQIQMSLNYLEQGNTAEAGKILRAVSTNPYLSFADKEALRDLNERLRRATAGDASAARMMSEPVNKDMKSLLTAARSALARGDLEMAEAFCVQADKVGYTIPPIFHPWSDTPSKVRREIQTTRAKLTTPPKAEGPFLAEKKDTGGPFAIVKSWFGGSKPKEEMPPRFEPRDPPVIAKGHEKPTPKDPAPIHHATSSSPRETPRKDLLPGKGMDVTPVTATAPGDKTRAVQLINEGYAALDRGDLANAQKFAMQAKAMRPDLAWWERNPDRLLNDIERRAGKPGIASAPPAKGTPAEARALVKEARALLGQNKIEDAEKMMLQAAGMPGMKWGLFEDNPDKVRGDIQRIKTKRDREEASRLLTEARTLYQAGNYHEAKVKAWQAQKLHGARSIWDLGDRPEKLLDEIHRAELKFKGNPPPKLDPGSSGIRSSDPSTIAKGPHVPGKGGAPASVASIERQKAIALLAEARDLQRRGQLAMARDKAVDAKKLGVPFLPDEDNPDAALWSLNALCDANVQAYQKRAIDSVNNNPTDPDRFKKAHLDLEAARKLAVAFQHDVAPVEQKILWLQQAALASGAPPVIPVAGTGGTTPAPTGMTATGKEKLERARIELRAGNTLVARRLAEEVYNPMFGVQEEALMVLRSIDAEEGNQARLGAERNARAGIDAFLRKDYGMANSVISSIDMRLLPPDLFARVREVMGAPEMIGSDALASKTGPSTGKTDIVPASAVELTESSDKVRAMEKIQFQQMRERTLVTLSNAHDLMTRGMSDKAIDVLNDHLSHLTKAGLEPELLSPLKRQVDFRIQQYRTMQAQLSIEKHTTGVSKAAHPERAREERIAKQQNQVKEKLDQFRALMKEGKFKDAQTAALHAVDIDPDNVAAQAAAQIAETQMRLKNWNDNKKRNEIGFERELNNNIGDWATGENPYVLNKGAWEKANKRDFGKGLATLGKTPFQKAVEEKMRQPVNVKFVNTPLEKVLDILRTEAGGVNIVPDRKALIEESVSLDQPITETLENLSLKSALKVILDQAKLTYVVREDYISITTPSQAQGKLRQVVHPVADLVVPVENHAIHPALSFENAMMRHVQGQTGMMYQTPTPVTPVNGMAPGTTVSSSSSGLGSMFGTSGGGSGGGSSVTKTNSNTIEDMLISLITNTVAHDTWNSTGGPGRIQYYPLGMALVINQTQEVQEEVLALLQALRRLQDLEVAIEMKLVNVSESFFERMGVDFDVNFRTGTSRREPDLVNGQFTPFGFVNRSLDRLGLVSGLTPAGTLTPDLNIPVRNNSFELTAPPFGGYPGLGQSGGLSLGLAFLSDIQVFMFMEAAQGDRRTQVMQAPRITVFNGQTAFIDVSDLQFFVLGVSQVQVGGQVVFQPQNTQFPIGAQLSVTPVISADRRFVRLNLSPTMRNNASATVPLFPVTFTNFHTLDVGGGNVQTGAPVIVQMFVQQPTISQIQLNTTVNVPDGGTVLLGGLKTMAEARNEFGPPILSKIPYLNRLFKNVGYGREVSSLMIMVTPRIIINEEEEEIFLNPDRAIPRE